MANRPEIKSYPVVEHYPAYTHGNWPAQDYSRHEPNRRSRDIELYLRGLLGKSVRVHTSNSGQIRGVLEAVLSDAIVLRTEPGQILINHWAIAAIECE